MDESLLLWINLSWAHPWLDTFLIWVSERFAFSYPLLFIVLCLLAWKYKGDGIKLWLILVVIISLGDIMGNILKEILQQPRPCANLHGIVREPGIVGVNPCKGNIHGMPSNHAINFFVLTTYICYMVRSYLGCLTLLAITILVCISRIYLAKHYPSQVMIGAMLGISLGLISAWLCIKYFAFARRILTSNKPTQLQHNSNG